MHLPHVTTTRELGLLLRWTYGSAFGLWHGLLRRRFPEPGASVIFGGTLMSATFSLFPLLDTRRACDLGRGRRRRDPPAGPLSMLQLRVFGAAAAMADVAARLEEIPGSRHVVHTGSRDAGYAVVMADLVDAAADRALAEVKRLGVPTDDVVLVRLDLIGPSVAQRPLASVVWADLVSQADANARPLARYLVFMIAAGVIAAFGVIYSNVTLVVGAMAISPDTLPITAAATALVLGRWRLTGRAVAALLIGLGVACIVGGVMTFALYHLGLLRAGFDDRARPSSRACRPSTFRLRS